MASDLDAAVTEYRLRVVPVTAEQYAQFGEVLTVDPASRLPVGMYGDSVEVYRPGNFTAEAPIEFLLTRAKVRPFTVRWLERHMELEQTFIPLSGDPFVQVVARPEAEEENGLPALRELRAFLVPGDVAVKLHVGTWHEVPFPLVDGTLRLSTSHARLTQGLQAELDARSEIGRLDVDKRSLETRLGVHVRVELP